MSTSSTAPILTDTLAPVASPTVHDSGADTAPGVIVIHSCTTLGTTLIVRLGGEIDHFSASPCGRSWPRRPTTATPASYWTPPASPSPTPASWPSSTGGPGTDAASGSRTAPEPCTTSSTRPPQRHGSRPPCHL
ncbi:hypothetical protein WKI68_05065 [Streptomyces sp. MS1.HAVA.3]|uniref:Uncharacterized protein n=1 Tax=Streptomyces caledonius TaxID=3134107 RepID=A0ABU8TZG5_9ACTN